MKLFPIFLLLLLLLLVVVTQWADTHPAYDPPLPPSRTPRRRSFMFFFVVELALVWQLWGIFLAQQLLNTGAPPPSQWGAEMEVNFKPYKRCHKLHLMALRAALTAGPPLKRDPRQQHIDIYFSAAAAAATLKKEKLNWMAIKTKRLRRN